MIDHQINNNMDGKRRMSLNSSIFRLAVSFQITYRYFHIIFSMWYCYLLSNQGTARFGSQGLQDTSNLHLNHQIISKYLEKQYSSLKSTFMTPVILVEKNQQALISQPKIQDEKKTRRIYSDQILLDIQRDITQKKVQVKQSLKIKTKRTPKIEKIMKEEEKGKGKNPGRNSTSNIFRVFLKLCSKPKLETIIMNKFKQITQSQCLPISYEYFKLRLKELSPSTSNYVNVKQFKKLWGDNTDFSRAFRCLFHWFIHSFAVTHCLTLRGKHKMMKQSIMHFLENLRQIEGELWETEKQQSELKLENVEEQSQKSVLTK